MRPGPERRAATHRIREVNAQLAGGLADEIRRVEVRLAALDGSSAAVDAATGTIFIATGSSPNSCATPYDAAMIALRASDLTLVSSWQVPAALQGPDGDFLASPMLFTANIGGVQRSLVGLVHKNGVYYTFDRSNISAGPIWSATVGLSGDCPICGPPGAAIAPSAWDGSAIYVGGNSTTINGATCNGSVRALDPATGTFIWQRCLGSPVLGAISVTRGVVAVAAGSSFYVFSAATGAILYVFQDTNPAPPPYTGGIASFWGGPAIGQGVLYVGDIAGSLFAFSV
jgi:outer membrane protein assembly factor BamB